MMFLASLVGWQIVLIVIGGVILLGLGSFLFIFFFSRAKVRKQVRDLQEKYEYFHALLIGQDAQYVRRLEMISRTNLLYADIYDRASHQFKDLKDRFDVRANSSIKSITDLIEKNQYSGIKKVYLNVRDVVEVYETEMNKFNNSLQRIIKPEEECHQLSANLKEELRRTKQDYYSKQADISLLMDSFDIVFDKIDKIFLEFDTKVDGALYDDARDIVANVSSLINEMKGVLSVAPALCALIQVVVPEKIKILESACADMKRDDIPLHHLMVKTGLQDIKAELEDITTTIKTLKTNSLAERLDAIVNQIDLYLENFEKEREAKDIFDQEYESVYEIVNALERKFIKLCNFIPQIKKIYVINDEYQNRIAEIKEQIDEVGTVKRALDTFVHSSTKQPYSMLVDKMKELREKSNRVIDSMEEFNDYLNSLKVHSEEAYDMVAVYFFKLKQAEKTLRDMNIFSKEKYAERFDETYHYLDVINETLRVSPIDVTKVMANINDLNSTGDKLLGEIDEQYNLCLLAESAIVYANRDRQHLNDLNKQLTQYEQAFFEGDFEKVYYDTGALLKKLHSDEDKEKTRRFGR